MVSTGPSSASGGSTTFTREPSGRRASQSGSASSARRPSGARMRSITCRRSASEAKRDAGLREPAAALDPDGRRPADEDLVDAGVAQQRLERTEADGALGHARGERGARARVEHARLALHEGADAVARVVPARRVAGAVDEPLAQRRRRGLRADPCAR